VKTFQWIFLAKEISLDFIGTIDKTGLWSFEVSPAYVCMETEKPEEKTKSTILSDLMDVD
jgi:hypothetical protein